MRPFRVDPTDACSISAKDAVALKSLNEVRVGITQKAINAGCLPIQKALGVTSGDTAGAVFSNSRETASVSNVLANYLIVELVMSASED